MAPKRKLLTLNEKVQLIEEAERTGKGCRALASQFDIGKTQVSEILKRKRDIMDDIETNLDGERKRRRHVSEYDDLNKLTWDWFTKCRSMNIPVSGPMVQEKALMFAKELGKTDFKASNGWLECFRKRHNIVFNNICGEAGDVSNDTVNEWKQRVPSLVQNFHPEDIYNCDETGLFYRALPDKSLNVKGSDCRGTKKSKDRLTALLCCNATGTDLRKPLVIGKSLNPRCFKNLKSLPVFWKANKKAWMNSMLFTEWLTEFDRDIGRSKRKIILFMDNAPSHPVGIQLKNVTLKYLPANTTSKLQPLDQGIIQCVKQNYRKRLLRAVLARIENFQTASDISKAINVYDACHWLASSWSEVKSTTVQKCFCMCGFPVSNEPPTEEDDPEDDIPLSELIKKTAAKLSIHDVETVEDFVNFDNNVPVNEELGDEWELSLLEEFKGQRSTCESCVSDDDGENDRKVNAEGANTTCTLTDHEGLSNALNLRSYGLNTGDSIIVKHADELISRFECRILHKEGEKKQTEITTFFTKS